jgi:signal transduction histidine kinase
VTYAGELLGALVVRRPQEALTPVELTLVDDLARQAALVLRNVILARELEGRLGELATRAAELAASRARLVAAQDEERRRLERDIHDGAQQHLVALVVQLRLVQALLEREPERAVQLVHDLREGVRNADQTIQDLVRGIRPPALRENGLVAALREVATTIPVLVEVTGTDRRYREELEATAYFCCVEAISNAVKHAAATTVTVTVRAQDDELAFAVRDDGAGFDPGRAPRGRGLSNIADRVEAVGGSFRVASSPGTGTWVEGRLPLRSGTVVATEPETALLTRSDTT